MKQQTPFFITITSEVLRDKDLNPIEKLIFTEIMALTYSCGYCYASNSHFADIFDRAIETISRNISKLQSKGYIYTEININDGNSRKIYVKYTGQPFPQKHQDPIDENVNTSCQKHQDPIDENVKHSNTVSNSISKSLKKDTASGFSSQSSYSEIPNNSINSNSLELQEIKKTAVKENLTTQFEKDFEYFYEAFEGKHPSKQPKRASKVYPRWKNAIKTHTNTQILHSVQKYAEYLQIATWRQKKDIVAWLNGAMYEIDWELEKLQEQQKLNKSTINNQNANTLRNKLNEHSKEIDAFNPADYF